MDESVFLSDWSFWVVKGVSLELFGMEGAVMMDVRAVRYYTCVDVFGAIGNFVEKLKFTYVKLIIVLSALLARLCFVMSMIIVMIIMKKLKKNVRKGGEVKEKMSSRTMERMSGSRRRKNRSGSARN